MSVTPVPMLDWPQNLFNDASVESDEESTRAISVPPYFKRAVTMLSMIVAGIAVHAGLSRVLSM